MLKSPIYYVLLLFSVDILTCSIDFQLNGITVVGSAHNFIVRLITYYLSFMCYVRVSYKSDLLNFKQTPNMRRLIINKS